MSPMGFFDVDNRYVASDAKNDPLVRINALVPWETFRSRLEEVWRKPADKSKSNAGCDARHSAGQSRGTKQRIRQAVVNDKSRAARLVAQAKGLARQQPPLALTEFVANGVVDPVQAGVRLILMALVVTLLLLDELCGLALNRADEIVVASEDEAGRALPVLQVTRHEKAVHAVEELQDRIFFRHASRPTHVLLRLRQKPHEIHVHGIVPCKFKLHTDQLFHGARDPFPR